MVWLSDNSIQKLYAFPKRQVKKLKIFPVGLRPPKIPENMRSILRYYLL